MSVPYETQVRFILEDTSEDLFQIEGLHTYPVEGDNIFLNGIGYRVESTLLYLEKQPGVSGTGKPFISKCELVVTVSVVV
jgi:hypothetical protein